MIELKNRDKKYICQKILGKTVQEAYIIVKGNFLKMQVLKVDNELTSNLEPDENTILVYARDGIVKKSFVISQEKE
jgi:hypothetical protein